MNQSLQNSGDVRLVQFPHPGKEHPVPSGKAPWRRGNAAHRRTFLLSDATYRLGAAGEDRHGEVAFWGEWEGPTDVVTELDPVPGGPQWLGRPDPSEVPPVFDDGTPPQNTDPFVWGDAIRYTFCRQPTNRKLRRLGRGSLILFGSNIQHRFVLDTVLVVAGWIDHARSADLRGITDDAYMRATVEPMYGWGEGKPHRLYVGATPANPVNGMFSFVPCRPGSGRDVRFARPAIELNGWIDRNLRMQARMSERPDHEIVAAWADVVAAVQTAGIALATRLSL